MRKREVESCREMERAAREGTGGVDFEIERWKCQIS